MACASDIQRHAHFLLGVKELLWKCSPYLTQKILALENDEQRCYLEKLYQHGMTGWGKDHAVEAKLLAVVGTGLSLSQIKVCLRVNANYKELLIACVLFSCHSLTIVTYWSSRIVDCVY